MGLGKTLQAISMLAFLKETRRISGPFLVIAPLSTISNWMNELSHTAPSLSVFNYTGSKEEREKMRKLIVDHILTLPPHTHSNPVPKIFSILVTTFEIILQDFFFLGKFTWRYTIIDEGHRLKNPESVLYKTLQTEYKIPSRILLTGTPVQNNLGELWALLHFLNPDLFNSSHDFETWFGKSASSASGLKRTITALGRTTTGNQTVIREILKPFLLRRLKDDVAEEIPGKSEIVVYTGLTELQKKFYKWVLQKDAESLGKSRTLNNILASLRKCCNHPYLFDGAEPEPFEEGDHIFLSSGKMIVLDKLLKHLQANGHRVLIFSQMTSMLDILQDYLQYKKYSYERLDGSVRGQERFLAIERFKSSETFVFLLSTRAGGQGLNLAEADTVIFFDSDWNPQVDLQAQARVHRIGQKKVVKIIRLVTQNSVEQVMLKRAVRKLQLSHAVMADDTHTPTHTSPHTNLDSLASVSELRAIIQYGLEKLGENETEMTDADADVILSRAVSIDSLLPELARKTTLLTEDMKEEEEDGDYLYDNNVTKKEKDSVALSRILEDSVVHAPIQRARPSQQEIEERKKEKQSRALLKKQTKWAEIGYISNALESNFSDTPIDTDEDDVTSKLLFLSGDATRPQCSPDEPVIILNAVDNSGSWGRGGFFSALASLSPACQSAYEQAGLAEDLHLGDAHLIDITEMQSRRRGKTFVAHLVVQVREKSGGVSQIRLPALQSALEKVALAALGLGGASVHLPRIGARIPGVNWYAIERLLRKCLSMRHVRAAVYYFSASASVVVPLNDAVPSVPSSSNFRRSPSPLPVPPAEQNQPKTTPTRTVTFAETKHRRKFDEGDSDEDADITQRRDTKRARVMHEPIIPQRHAPTETRTVAPPAFPQKQEEVPVIKSGHIAQGPRLLAAISKYGANHPSPFQLSAIARVELQPFPNIFNTHVIALHGLATPERAWKRYIAALGGRFCPSDITSYLNPPPTHIVTDFVCFDDAIANAQLRWPGLIVLNSDWLRASISSCTLAETGPYSVPRTPVFEGARVALYEAPPSEASIVRTLVDHGADVVAIDASPPPLIITWLAEWDEVLARLSGRAPVILSPAWVTESVAEGRQLPASRFCITGPTDNALKIQPESFY
eukprot:TRINITY_DN6827_c0_g1_i1.p1 TRINITY_DN6827_c0_g1~~TRINITY_DN6827_c0_g1_i1.p1  ORF type:complete len:1231 (-),score=308.94 TRINITY_DN6827_c0_g1_i1:64-3459(-)